jgi:hypothetical protein
MCLLWSSNDELVDGKFIGFLNQDPHCNFYLRALFSVLHDILCPD